VLQTSPAERLALHAASERAWVEEGAWEGALGLPLGAVAALDVKTGATVWKTYTIAEAPKVQGTNRAGANRFGPSGAPVWSTPTIDPKRGRLYIGTGENYSHPATATSDAIMALDLASGRIVWTFQATANDVWNAACPSGPNCPVNTGPDYDFGAAPILVELPDDRAIVLAGQKSGDVYGLDPDKGGAVLWKAKPGRGGIMGGVHWGMATDGKTLFVPISDLSVYPQDAHLPAQSGMHALDIATGKQRPQVDRPGSSAAGRARRARRGP
jgi:polyvinyl alcohol dehydrogenase (cytochrome)